ncbi:MAG TPA: SCO family protein [Planctomycetes bacterium]|nr:SCO family protein [Planctomycetota bacterium]
MKEMSRTPLLHLWSIGLSLLLLGGRGHSQKNVLPKELEGIGVDQKLGVQIPTQLMFRDSSGRKVSLKAFFDGKRPVFLTFNYTDCPQLCSLQLNSLNEALKSLDWTPGKEFRILTVSMDPTETPEKAAGTKALYLHALAEKKGGEKDLRNGWEFLTGEDKNIRALADAVGFHYRFLPDRKEYAHKAALITLSPEGKVLRYLSNINYSPRDLKFALLEAGEGKVGSAVDNFFLSCFDYDPRRGGYVLAAVRIMKVGGVLTLLLLGLFWFSMARMKKKKALLLEGQGHEEGDL